jgi:hypothetical protein
VPDIHEEAKRPTLNPQWWKVQSWIDESTVALWPFCATTNLLMGGEISGNRDTSNRGDFLDNIGDCANQRLHGGNESPQPGRWRAFN